MIFDMIMLLCCILLLGFVIFNGGRDLKLFKKRGKQLYTYKSISKDRYILLIIQLTYTFIVMLNWYKDKSYVSIGIRVSVFGCLVIACVIVGSRCFRKNVFYEHMISAEGIYYAKERVQSYYWNQYVMRSDKEGLMLEIKNLSNDKKTVVEIAVPKEDKEKLEAILATYGAALKIKELDRQDK